MLLMSMLGNIWFCPAFETAESGVESFCNRKRRQPFFTLRYFSTRLPQTISFQTQPYRTNWWFFGSWFIIVDRRWRHRVTNQTSKRYPPFSNLFAPTNMDFFIKKPPPPRFEVGWDGDGVWNFTSRKHFLAERTNAHPPDDKLKTKRPATGDSRPCRRWSKSRIDTVKDWYDNKPSNLQSVVLEQHFFRGITGIAVKELKSQDERSQQFPYLALQDTLVLDGFDRPATTAVHVEISLQICDKTTTADHEESRKGLL